VDSRNTLPAVQKILHTFITQNAFWYSKDSRQYRSAAHRHQVEHWEHATIGSGFFSLESRSQPRKKVPPKSLPITRTSTFCGIRLWIGIHMHIAARRHTFSWMLHVKSFSFTFSHPKYGMRVRTGLAGSRTADAIGKLQRFGLGWLRWCGLGLGFGGLIGVWSHHKKRFAVFEEDLIASRGLLYSYR
jgi:hypothetical protein